MRNDLVKRNEVMESLANEYNKRYRVEGDSFRGLKLAWIEKAINDVHLAVPEIIRCRECKFVEHDKLFHDFWCRGREVEPDHFCGYAERRDNEQ